MHSEYESIFDDDYSLVIKRKVAKRIGLNEAIILQQIYYWTLRKNKAHQPRGHLRDGNYWHYETMQGFLDEFTFWSLSTIKRTIDNLKKMNLLLTANYNASGMDRTVWYAVNLKEVKNLFFCRDDNELDSLNLESARVNDSEHLDESSHLSESTNRLVQLEPMDSVNLNSCIIGTKTTTTKTTKKNNNKKNRDLMTEREKEQLDQFELFWQTYKIKVAKPKAREAFIKALEKVEFSKMLESLENLVKEWNLKNYFKFSFIPSWPHPATWLNKERWDDVPMTYEEIKSSSNSNYGKGPVAVVDHSIGAVGGTWKSVPEK